MLTNIIEGVKAYFSAIELLNKLKLWKYFAVPVLISVATAILIFVLAYFSSDAIGGQITSLWSFNWGQEVISTISNFIGGAVIVVFGLVVYRHVVMAFSAPFMSPISEAIEKHYLGDVHTDAKFSITLARAIKINARNLFKELLFIIPLFFLSLIPVIGIFFTVLILLVQAYYAGFGNMDYTLERHYNYKDSITFIKQHKGIAIGNGIVFMLLLMIPVVGVLLVLPLSVVSDTKETVKRVHQEK